MPQRSRYVLVVDNVSSMTSARDLTKEMEYTAGRVRDITMKPSTRCALVEFERSDDCEYAWRKMDGFRMDGRAWKVQYATPSDFRYFGWKWFEGSEVSAKSRRSSSPSPSRSRSMSPSRSRSPPPKTKRSKAASRSPSVSRSPAKSRSPSTSPRPTMQTPGNVEGKQH